MYNLGDKTWMDQPSLMSLETIDALIFRVAEHCRTHSNSSFTYCFHGGEPMLMPQERMAYFVETARQAMPRGTKARFLMQTNGILLTPDWCAALKEMGIKIGVSLDGPKMINDRYRIDHKGNGTYDRVLLGLRNAQIAGLDYSILSVVDIDSQPEEVFEHMVSLKPSTIDLLLPEATHDQPPNHGSKTAPYADWLLRFFDLWCTIDNPPFRIRRFDSIIDITLGLVPPLSELDDCNNEILVVETDGSLEPMDVLKVCEPGMTKTSLNVYKDCLDDASDHPLIKEYYRSYANPCETCASCPVVSLCGGGYFPHRYSHQKGFANPSVYCQDLKLLIKGIQGWTFQQLPAEIVESTGLCKID